jgi:hypothetical protein
MNWWKARQIRKRDQEEIDKRRKNLQEKLHYLKNKPYGTLGDDEIRMSIVGIEHEPFITESRRALLNNRDFLRPEDDPYPLTELEQAIEDEELQWVQLKRRLVYHDNLIAIEFNGYLLTHERAGYDGQGFQGDSRGNGRTCLYVTDTGRFILVYKTDRRHGILQGATMEDVATEVIKNQVYHREIYYVFGNIKKRDLVSNPLPKEPFFEFKTELEIIPSDSPNLHRC